MSVYKAQTVSHVAVSHENCIADELQKTKQEVSLLIHEL
jgi:hypothetical protein